MVSASDPASALALLFALLIGHALADFPLQGEFIANGKNRHLPAPKLGDGGEPPKFLWIYLMSAHSLIQAGFVWAITGSVLLGFAEFVIHWAIDSAKCEGRTSFGLDQGLHIATKLVYVVIIWMGWF